MTGYIKLEAMGDERIQADVELQHVGNIDKALLLDAFMQGINMSDEDVLAALLMRIVGIVSGESTKMSFDMDTLRKMREIKNGGDD